MSRVSYLQDLLSSIFERGAHLTGLVSAPDQQASITTLCHDLLSMRGEASGTRVAGDILNLYRTLDGDQKTAFFQHLADDLDVDPDAVTEAAAAYAEARSPGALTRLLTVSEPARQEILRRLNMAPGGTAELVRMRTDLLVRLRDHPELRRVDIDFEHLFSSWFNRGFLVLRPIDWATPAYILEKIIEYEAVHEIGDWNELRRRLEPKDRRCFAFFHPAMPDEPLIFVEVALTRDLASSVQALLNGDREEVPENEATTAIFYSISNCQKGLRGVTFGNFLIKQVASDLASELPSLTTFATLSPIPGYRRWLEAEATTGDPMAADAQERLADPGWILDDGPEAEAERLLTGLAGRYFLEAKRGDGKPVDPVARFHLGNGAELHRLNWRGDISEKGIEQSAGMMVNYLYDLDRVEENHEAYAAHGDIKASRQVRNLLIALERQVKERRAEQHG
ncbi:MAG: malonyl-CoA decarboxylase [Hyphomicrobiales bacterium]|nr:malonyl-CoA decarboxylase [Hyphomicrobiales bacterium]